MHEKTCSGFTLIELLVTITIITLLFSIGVAQYNKFNRRQILVKAKDELVSNLRLTQSKSLAAEKPSGCTDTLTGHKIKFINNQNYKIVAVCGNEIDLKTDIVLPTGVTKQAGSNEVFFKVLNRGVEFIGGQPPIVLILTGTNETQNINISAVGEIK